MRWSNKYTYFLRGDEYYRFDDREFTIDKGDPPYPRPTGPWWFGCKEAEPRIAGAEREGSTSIFSIFDEVSDEDLDVEAGDS